MLRLLGTTLLASAAYGFACGAVHSLRFAIYGLVKFPLLLLGTALICALAYSLGARFCGVSLAHREVLRLSGQIYRDAAVLLWAFAPATLFLALTIRSPSPRDLGEYPLFLAFNVIVIACAGTIALLRVTRRLLREKDVPKARAAPTLCFWLAVSLVVGGQWAWYLRPFFGVASIDGATTRFCLGAAPDYRGATSFFEAVYHLLDPPPLPRDFTSRGKGHAR
jgi:hypothetical protein